MFFNWFKKNKPSADQPDFWRRYLERMNDPSFNRKTPISEARFVVFDTETTGLDVRKDQILSIGAVSVRHWRIDLTDTFECYIRQSYQPEQETIAVHGILPVFREEELSEAAALERFVDYIGDSILVGHHVSFDVGIVNNSLRQLVGSKLANATLDTISLAQRLASPTSFAKEGEFTLDHLARRFNISASDRHTAAGDAYITAVLFMKMVRRMESRGVATVRDLLR